MVRSLLILLAGCSSAAPPAASPASAPPAAPAATPPSPSTVAPDALASAGDTNPASPTGVLEGVCEASTILPWQGGWLVGDNEDKKRLHSYGPDFTPRGPVPLPAIVDDIEALALVDGGYWVVGSHSTNKDGEPRPDRERILGPDGRAVTVALDACPRCLTMKGLRPDAGGFNIEGAAWFGSGLWVGLRGPLSDTGAALLLRLDDAGGIAETVEVDLGGQAIREMIPHGTGLLLVGGAVADSNQPHTLWRLSAPGATPERLPVALPASTEGIAVDPTDPTSLVYVTDGDGKPGKPCKTPSMWGRVVFPG